MVAETKIHSGSFVDYNGNEIEVEFYRRVNLNAEPASFSVDGHSHTLLMTVWSRDGEAYVDSYPTWVICGEIWTTDIPGSPYHKHIYTIYIDAEPTGNERETLILVGIQGNNWAQIEVPIHQDALTLRVVPSSIMYHAEQSTNGITVYWTDGTEPTVSIRYTLGEDGWLTNNGSYIQDEHTKEWSFIASDNTTEISREAYIDVTNGIDTVSVFLKQRTH